MINIREEWDDKLRATMSDGAGVNHTKVMTVIMAARLVGER